MIESACDFATILCIFPFLMILIFAGILAFIIFGMVLLITGAKNKWQELNKAGRVFKIIKIVAGSIMLVIAVLLSSYIAYGFGALWAKGGFFGKPQSSSNIEGSAALLNYLSMIL